MAGVLEDVGDVRRRGRALLPNMNFGAGEDGEPCALFTGEAAGGALALDEVSWPGFAIARSG